VTTVLVTDGEERSALACVRSLGAAGHRVVVIASTSRSLAGSSRYANISLSAPSPLADPSNFAAAVVDAVRENGIDCVFPISEASLLAVLPLRPQLPNVLIPFPGLDQFATISDKARLLEKAAELGIAVPAQRSVGSRADVDAMDIGDVHFPVVLKPARSVVNVGAERIKVGVRHAADGEALRRQLLAYPEGAYPVLVQQRIVGPGIGNFLLLWDGRVIAEFSHRRIREKPPAGGVSVYRESIATDHSVAERSRRLLEAFDWRGVAMVEYKQDSATGTLYLMEINGRFWGSLQLAIDAGVDFPVLLLKAATGQPQAGPLPYQTGIRSRWWWGDVDQLIARFRRSATDLALPPDDRGRGHAMLDFAKVWRRGDRNEVFRFGDPRPLLTETMNWFRGR
jgi:predicted ATP-grasp superfamily ATP-dependent carboligase